MKKFFRFILAIFFIVAGINHFYMPELYIRMIPDYLPEKLLLVQISGVAEIFLGVLSIMDKYRKIAKWGLVLLLIAIFPANINMALNPQLFPQINELILWLRLPFQLVFIFFVLRILR